MMAKFGGALAIVLLAVVALPASAFLTATNVEDSGNIRGCSEVIADGPAARRQMARLAASQVHLARIIWLRAYANADQLGRGHSDQAATIAIAVATQESSLGAAPTSRIPNADGDAGPFQQRTLPGWYGTVAQVTDPTYAADAFYLGHTVTAAQYTSARRGGTQPAGPAGYHLPGLANIPRWSQLDIVDAAQRVQHSAHPNAIANHIPLARVLVDSFEAGGGRPTPGAAHARRESTVMGCEGTASCPPTGLPAETGLQPDTLLVLRCVKQRFEKVTIFYGVRPDPLPDHPAGLAVDIMVSSAYPDYNSPAAVAYGHAIAAWLQAHHTQLGVHYLIYRQHIWNVQRGDEGWRLMSDRGSPTANHMDHVHVTTYGHAATDLMIRGRSETGPAVSPVQHYTITARFGQTGPWARYHTGLDFAAPVGTPVRAALAGVVTHAGYGAAAPWAGDYITIRHPNGGSTLYAHMAAHSVHTGQAVTTGQQVGVIGVTGRSFGPHLHFEAYPTGVEPGAVYRAIDPVRWLRSRGASLAPGAHG